MVKALDKTLENWPEQKSVKILTIIAAIFFLIFFVIMRVIGSSVEESSYNVFDLELAWTPERMDTILSTWGDDLIEKELLVTYVDFGFLVAYGTLLAGLSLLFARFFKGEILGKFGFKAVYVSYVASAFDFLENLVIIVILNNPETYPTHTPFLVSMCATIKFLLIFIVIAYLIVAFFIFIHRFFPSKER